MNETLVIGANGYLGQNFALALAGRSVILHSKSPPNPICVSTKLPFIQEDLEFSCDQLSHLNPTEVYILARPALNEPGPNLTFQWNMEQLLHIWAQRNCLKRLAFMSTQLVYATPSSAEPISSQAPLGPIQPYEIGKLKMELFLRLFCSHNHIALEIFRLPIIYGGIILPHQRPAQFLTFWQDSYACGKKWNFTTEDNPQWGNSWVCVEDLVNLILLEKRRTDTDISIIQPVSGHFTYFSLHEILNRLYEVPQKGELKKIRESFFLKDEADMPKRDLAGLIKANDINQFRSSLLAKGVVIYQPRSPT